MPRQIPVACRFKVRAQRHATDACYALAMLAFGHRKVVSGSADSTRPRERVMSTLARLSGRACDTGRPREPDYSELTESLKNACLP